MWNRYDDDDGDPTKSLHPPFIHSFIVISHQYRQQQQQYKTIRKKEKKILGQYDHTRLPIE